MDGHPSSSNSFAHLELLTRARNRLVLVTRRSGYPGETGLNALLESAVDHKEDGFVCQLRGGCEFGGEKLLEVVLLGDKVCQGSEHGRGPLI